MSPTFPAGREQITELLLAWRQGDAAALDRLMPIVYEELRRLAHGYLGGEQARRRPLQTTELVHEAYLRLVGADIEWQGRSHFFVIAARAMRRILVDQARRNNAAKRDGAEVPLLEADLPHQPPVDLLLLDEALEQLAAIDPRKSQVIELRFFAGLTLAETAHALGVSTATVERDLRMAKAWLGQAVRGLADGS